jgi:hypothetical protein
MVLKVASKEVLLDGALCITLDICSLSCSECSYYAYLQGGKSCADVLANMGCDESVDFLDFHAAPPPQLSQLVAL